MERIQTNNKRETMMRFMQTAGLLCLFLCFSCHKGDESCVTCPPPSGSDTTSHAWTFTATTLGDGAGSDLYDVAIVNDTLAYAVGEIYLKDSTGQFDLQAYNLAVWHSGVWNLQRAPYRDQGQLFYHPIHAVFAFGQNDIWFGGNGLVHWDGIQYSNVATINQVWGPHQIRRLWGTSGNDLYVVGDGGSIAHNQSGIWQKIATGTSLNFYDVYGSGGSVLAVASNPFVNFDRKIVQLNGNLAAPIEDSPISWPLLSIWFVPNEKYFVVGTGIYEKGPTDPTWRSDPIDSTLALMQSVRGNSSNDVFVVGQSILHFNGKSWQSYPSQTLIQDGGYGSVAVRGNLVIAVGLKSPFAVVAIGRR